MLFAIFNFYNFSFPFGFSYSALATSMCFMLHSMLFFWHRYELPAVILGRVSPEHPRQSNNGASPSESGRSTPEHHAMPPAGSVPHGARARPPIRPSASFSSTVASGRLSRNSSAGGLFHGGDSGEDDGSYVFFMDGEVVVHRNNNNNQEPRARTPSPVTSQAGGVVDPANAATEPRRNRLLGNNNHSHRLDSQQQLQQPPQRLVHNLGTRLATGASTDEVEEAHHAAALSPSSPGRHRPRYGGVEVDDDHDDHETSALQAILNASGEVSPGSSMADDDDDGPRGSPADLLRPPPSVPRSPLLHIPGLGPDDDDAATD